MDEDIPEIRKTNTECNILIRKFPGGNCDLNFPRMSNEAPIGFAPTHMFLSNTLARLSSIRKISAEKIRLL